MSKKYEATGRYYVARYTLPIVYNGLVYWPIIDPQGTRLVTVLGGGIDPGPQHDAQMAASRAPANKLVEILNKTLP